MGPRVLAAGGPIRVHYEASERKPAEIPENIGWFGLPMLKVRLWKVNEAFRSAVWQVAMHSSTDGVIVANVQPMAQLGVSHEETSPTQQCPSATAERPAPKKDGKEKDKGQYESQETKSEGEEGEERRGGEGGRK